MSHLVIHSTQGDHERTWCLLSRGNPISLFITYVVHTVHVRRVVPENIFIEEQIEESMKGFYTNQSYVTITLTCATAWFEQNKFNWLCIAHNMYGCFLTVWIQSTGFPILWY